MKIAKPKCYKNFNKILKLDKLKTPEEIVNLDFDRVIIDEVIGTICILRSKNKRTTAFQDQFGECSVHYCDDCIFCKENNKASDIKDYINYLKK